VKTKYEKLASSIQEIGSERTIGKVVDEIESILVVDSPKMSLSNGQSNTVSETLAERTSGNFNAYSGISTAHLPSKIKKGLSISVASLGVTRSFGIKLAERLEVI
jgi:hypothetical protein